MMTRNKKKAGRGYSREEWIEHHQRIVRRSERAQNQRVADGKETTRIQKENRPNKSEQEIAQVSNSGDDSIENMDTEETWVDSEITEVGNKRNQITGKSNEILNKTSTKSIGNSVTRNTVLGTTVVPRRSTIINPSTNDNSPSQNLIRQFEQIVESNTTVDGNDGTDTTLARNQVHDATMKVAEFDINKENSGGGNKLERQEEKRNMGDLVSRRGRLEATIQSVIIKKEQTDMAASYLSTQPTSDGNPIESSSIFPIEEGETLEETPRLENMAEVIDITQTPSPSSYKRKKYPTDAENLGKKQYGSMNQNSITDMTDQNQTYETDEDVFDPSESHCMDTDDPDTTSMLNNEPLTSEETKTSDHCSSTTMDLMNDHSLVDTEIQQSLKEAAPRRSSHALSSKHNTDMSQTESESEWYDIATVGKQINTGSRKTKENTINIQRGEKKVKFEKFNTVIHLSSDTEHNTGGLKERGFDMTDKIERITTPIRIEYNLAPNVSEFNVVQECNELFHIMSYADPTIRVSSSITRDTLWDTDTKVPKDEQFKQLFQLREQRFRKGNGKVTIYCVIESVTTINRMKFTDPLKQHILEWNIWIKPD